MNAVEKAIQLKKELDSLRPLKKEDELRIMQFCYPPGVIKTEDKQNYFSVLRQADTKL